MIAGSAAGAVSSASGAGPKHPSKPATASIPAADHGRVSFRPITGQRSPNLKLRTAGPGPSSNDAFGRLGRASFAAYGTGTVLHSDPELSEGDIGATVDMAVADAVYAGDGLSAFADELGRSVLTGLAPKSGLAHGRAITIDPPDAVGDDVDMGDPADSKAPPIDRPVVRETTADLSPVTKADLLRAEAAARAVSTGCVIGDDLARAVASADDTEVADTDFDPKSSKPLLSLSADDPGRAVSQSTARTYLVPLKGAPGRFAAVAEVRQTIAPVTFGIPGSDEKFTIEVAGEWVMRATSDGTKGFVTFGAEKGDQDDRPVLRLVQGDDVVDDVGLRDLREDRTGIFVNGDPVGEILVGGDARAVLGRPESRPNESPTRVSAAGDVVVVRLFESGAQLRIGHMEVGLAVPAGGVQCPGIELTKTSDPAAVRPGDPFSWNLEVSNPNDCLLDGVKVTDSPDASRGVEWQALTSVPRATRSPNGDLVFEGIGAIATGETRALKINAQVDPGSTLGTITNRATAIGLCGDAQLAGAAEAATNVAMTVVPAIPGPPARLANEGDGPRRDSRPSPDQSAAAPATSSGSSSRTAGASFASATRSAGTAKAKASAAPAASANRRSAVSSQAQGSSTASAAPLPKSGADTLPSLTLALGLLGAGRMLRLVKTRRQS